MMFVDLDTAAKQLLKSHGASIANVVQTLIFRNDWKVGEQFRAICVCQRWRRPSCVLSEKRSDS